MTESLIPVLAWLLKSTVIVLVAWAIARLLREHGVSAVARHLVWLGAFAALALLPALSILLPPVELALPYAELGFAVANLSLPGHHHPDTAGSAWIRAAYLLGLFLMLLHFLLGRLALHALWRKAKPVSDSRFAQWALPR